MSAWASLLQGPLNVLDQGLQELQSARYLIAIGATLLLYDQILTFSDEVEYAWRAPSSFGRNGFLVNKYLTIAGIMIIIRLTSRIQSGGLSTSACRGFFGIVILLATYSIGFIHLLVMLRVAVIWDRKLILLRNLFVLFAITILAQVILTIFVVKQIIENTVWMPSLDVCYTVAPSHFLAAAWAMPLPFILLVLSLTVYSSLSTPRIEQVPLVKVLRRDGALIFLALFVFELAATCFLGTGNQLEMLSIPPFLWTICTIIVNRFLLRIRAIESSHRAEGYSKHGPEDRVALEMEFVDGRSSVSELLE